MSGSGTPELVVHRYGLTDTGAPTLVLLHGLTDAGRCWPDAVARWGGAYRILAPDALGHGESPRFTPGQLASGPGEHMFEATIAALGRHLGPGTRPVLVGHSMGGAMAGAIAARRPDLVRAAVLEDPAWLAPDAPHDESANGVRWLADFERRVADPEGEVARERAANPSWPDAEFAPWIGAKLRGDPGFLAHGAAFVRDPWTGLAAAIDVPVLVVTGTMNTIVAGSRATIEAIGNPNIEIAVIDGAGHCVRRDRTEAFHALVDPWIAARFAEADPAR